MKLLGIITIIVLCFSLILPVISASQDWWNSDWQMKKAIYFNVTFSNKTLTSTLINVSYDSDMKSDFGDLRFVDSSEKTEIGYWFYNNDYIAGNSVQVWVNTGELNATSNKTIYMYYGNAGVTTTSNISSAFMFGDDFLGTAVDWTNKWQSNNKELYSVSNGSLILAPGIEPSYNIGTKKTYSDGYVTELRYKFSDDLGTYWRSAQPNIANHGYSTIGIADNGYFHIGMGTGFTSSTPGTALENVYYRSIQEVNTSGIQTWKVTNDAGETILSRTDTLSAYSGYNTYLCFLSGVGTMDWNFIRRLVPIEPTVTFSEEEKFTACSANSDCGIDGWILQPYCYSNDLLQVNRIYQCLLPGTHESSCSYTDSLELKQDCGVNYCDGWGDNYCKGNNIYHSRTCYTVGCSSAACFNNSNIEEQQVQSCGFVECEYGQCKFENFTLNIKPGWNLISIPVEPLNSSREFIFPSSTFDAVWEYIYGYGPPKEIHTKIGYWVKANKQVNITIIGARPKDKSVHINPGWNLIGIVGTAENQSKPYPNESWINAIWEYLPPYNIPSILNEGRGFWIKSSADGNLFSAKLQRIKYSSKTFGDIPALPTTTKKK